jgi:hypothetical protein
LSFALPPGNRSTAAVISLLLVHVEMKSELDTFGALLPPHAASPTVTAEASSAPPADRNRLSIRTS